MKTTLNTFELRAFLKAAKPFVSNRVIPILETVQIQSEGGKVVATATNLEIYLQYEFQAANIQQPGRICIPFKEFQAFVNTTTEQTVSIEAGADYLVNISGMKIQGQGIELGENDEPTNQFPELPKLEKPEILTFSSLLFHEVETATKYVGNDDLRPVMSGVFIGTSGKVLTIAATDSHRLYKGEIARIEKEFQVLVPGFAAQNLPKIAALLGDKNGNIEMLWDTYNVEFRQGNFILISRQIDGKYPNFNAVIPKDNPIQVTFDKAAMLKAIDKVKIAAGSGKQVTINFEGDRATLVCMDIEFNKEMQTSIPCKVNGEGIEIAFNYSFLTEVLKSTISPDVTLQMSADNRAALIQDFHRTFLLMPVMKVEKAEA